MSDVTEIVTNIEDRIVTGTSTVDTQATEIVTSSDDRIVTGTSAINTPDSDVDSQYSKYQLKHIKEEFENTTLVIRIRKSKKVKQHNGQKKKD